MSIPELLAPAGNWACARAAIENGADAIYFGLEKFNARMRADNFTAADLPSLMEFLHHRGVKGYVTFNTLVFPSELAQAEAYLRTIIAAGVDAVIVQDVGMCRLIRHLSPDFPIHGSTQMTITSAAGVAFARSIGCDLVVLARECALTEIQKIRQETAFPLEIFVHGALCVAYSGQCLTSEALGGRSANRGECAQACRMPYELIVDGIPLDLGNRPYLLSPQDLSGLPLLPEIIASGVVCLKIEGRLKTPEYVAAVTQTYRQAIDRVVAGAAHEVTPADRYTLEMSFSRGLYTGWLGGIDNQSLVHGEFAKKRGVYLGTIARIHDRQVWMELAAPLKPGDGVVIATARGDVGGRIYGIRAHGNLTALTFGRHDLDLRHLRPGDRLWKTSDPALENAIRQTFQGEQLRFQQPIAMEVYGEAGFPLTLIAKDRQGHIAQVQSAQTLEVAQRQPLTTDRLQEQLGRLGNTPFRLETLVNHLPDNVILPVSGLNHLRRSIVAELEQLRRSPPRWQLHASARLEDLLPDRGLEPDETPPVTPQLIVLVRTAAQLDAAIALALPLIYCELEDPRRYPAVVQKVHAAGYGGRIWVAPPRITKPGENYVLKQVLASQADGYLVRNYDQLAFFAEFPMVADFSLNIANPLTARYFLEHFHLQRLTASYDLNVEQLEALVGACPATWFEITLHQHMPMFHMEHCVFCAFLSEGTDYTNCGRPCEHHEVKVKDRTGAEHLLLADAGCRNTVFNGTAQTGAEYLHKFCHLGVQYFRLEFLNESAAAMTNTIVSYQALLAGKISGRHLWNSLRIHHQLGVTRGSIGHGRGEPFN